MKNILTLAIAVLSLSAFAQGAPQDRPNRNAPEMRMIAPDFTPEQQATLQTKRMTLNLDLTASQQKEVYNLNIEQAKLRQANREAMQNAKASGKTLTDDERYNKMVAHLDQQIAYRDKMKSILKSEQYNIWKEHREDNMNRGRDIFRNQHPKKRNFKADGNGPNSGRRS